MCLEIVPKLFYCYLNVFLIGSVICFVRFASCGSILPSCIMRDESFVTWFGDSFNVFVMVVVCFV